MDDFSKKVIISVEKMFNSAIIYVVNRSEIMNEMNNTTEYVFSFNKHNCNPIPDNQSNVDSKTVDVFSVQHSAQDKNFSNSDKTDIFDISTVNNNNGSSQSIKSTSIGDDFEESLKNFTSADVPKKKKKKKRSVGSFDIGRIVALCLCVGVLVYALYMIYDKFAEYSSSEAVNNQAENIGKGSLIEKLNSKGNLSPSRDLLTYLGSDTAGIDEINQETRTEYEKRRQQLLDLQAAYPNSRFYGYITVSDTAISYPIMIADDNDYYLKHLFNGQYQERGTGSIFADYRLQDNYDDNMNVIVYGHCMTNGTMFRPIKYFFDNDYRYSQAQTMKITVVTIDGVYIYEYFAAYRSEGDDFINRYTVKSDKDRYYNFLKRRRRLNSIDRQVSYNENSKIITLVTCTNVPNKQNERYVLHGILTEHYTFGE